MDSLTVFGLLAVTLMLVFYALEDRNPLFILAFAGACALVCCQRDGPRSNMIPDRYVWFVWSSAFLIPWFAAGACGFQL